VNVAKPFPPAAAAKQRGAALFMVLMLLLVMTVLVLASMRGTVLQERMTANTYDRSLAFQAAEAALREGERWVMENPPKPAAGACDGTGTCGIPAPANAPVWQDEDTWDEAHSAADAHAHTIDVGTLPVPPKFIVELLADSVPEVDVCGTTSIDPDAPCFSGPEGLRYRITARSGGGSRAEVTLQSTFAVPKPAGW
jgi:type IV pilus assembly protein PilX